ncbi:MAG: peptidase M13 [Gemmatimonadetes bacterium]|nr:peptidase M13 [Gemmatimonadota bacterium]
MKEKPSFVARLSLAAGACLLAGGLAGAARAQTPAQPTLGIDVRNFDRSVRPQDDFFRYVNGTWLKTYRLPEDRTNYGTFTELADRSDLALRRLIEQAAATPGKQPGSDLQKVGDFYAAFLDSARVERLGVAPLRGEMARIAGARGKAEFPALFAHLARMGVQTPFSASVAQDDRKADEYVVTVYQSGLGLPDRDYYSNPGPRFVEARAAYARYVETLLRMAGTPDAAGAARSVVALEDSLARAQWDRTRNRDPNAVYNRFTVAGLDSLTPSFAWSRFIPAAGLERTPAVVVRQPSYVQAAGRAIERVPLPVWKQYLTFKLLDAYAGYLGRDWVDAQFAFEGRTLGGLEQMLPRWKRGLDAVEGSMGMLAGRLYVEQTFQPEAKARMQRLVANVMDAFRVGIDSLEWMSPATREQARAKLAHLNVKIAYPDPWPDYSGLEVRAGDLVGNVMRAREFAYQREANKLGKPIDRTEWGMTPQTVNAYYNASMNEIVFPAAILLPPFFDPAADDATNYGAIGAVIGHETSHAFDDQGSQYDPVGNLRNWWTPEDAAAFKARTDRLAEQYSAFSPLEGMNINGRLTLGENIGDVSGLAVAYRAYRRSLNGREAPVIDGFTGDQRFFMGWAQVWRRMYREANLRERLLTDPHSPSEFRVNGVLRNMPQFYAAFDVKPGDRMYLPPEQRVKIW